MAQQKQLWNVVLTGKMARMNPLRSPLIFVKLEAPMILDGVGTFEEVVTVMDNIPDADPRRMEELDQWALNQGTATAPRVMILQVSTDERTGPNHLPMATIALMARQDTLRFPVMSQVTDLLDAMRSQERYEAVQSSIADATRAYITHVREIRAEDRRQERYNKPAPGRSGNGDKQHASTPAPAPAKLPEPEPKVPQTITVFTLAPGVGEPTGVARTEPNGEGKASEPALEAKLAAVTLPFDTGGLPNQVIELAKLLFAGTEPNDGKDPKTEALAVIDEAGWEMKPRGKKWTKKAKQPA